MILAILNLYVALMPPIKFWLNPTWEEMLIEKFQDCHHGGYQNGRILAILNLHVATMPPTKFQLNPTYGSGGMLKMWKANDGWWMDDGQEAMA